MEHSKPSNDFAVALIEALQRGDTQQVWHEFLHSYASTILRVVAYCERESENRSEAFVFVCEQLHQGNCRRLRKFKCNGPASFNTWLHAVVRNLCRDWRRKTFGRLDPSSQEIFVTGPPIIRFESLDGEEILEKLVDPEPDPTILFDLKQQAANLSEALRSLPAKERLAVLLRTPPFDAGVLQVMPWPVQGNMSDDDLRAVYEYLKAIPCISHQGSVGLPSNLYQNCQ